MPKIRLKGRPREFANSIHCYSRAYFIPDFSNWNDHDAFEAGFARLMEGLKAEGPMHRKTD